MAQMVWVAGLGVLLVVAALHNRAADVPLYEQHVAAAAPHQSPPRSRELRQTIRVLVAEARDARDAGLADDAQPDFAERYDHELSTELVEAALRRPQHHDPFIDAYIRWQLLSFEPNMPDLDDRAFLRMLSDLPVLLPNPRGDPAFMNLADRAAQLESLTPDDFQRLQEIDDEASQAMESAEALNRPAFALREWIRDGVAGCRLRTLQSFVEQCAATIDGAWPTRSVKTALTRTFTEAADQLDDAQKRLLAEQTRALVGRENRYVNSITYFANRSVNVSYSRPRVTQRDYDRWMQRLAGDE